MRGGGPAGAAKRTGAGLAFRRNQREQRRAGPAPSKRRCLGRAGAAGFCEKDRKGATSGSGAQHGSVAHPCIA